MPLVTRRSLSSGEWILLLALGAADYIPKPFDLEYLDQAVSIQLTASPDS